LADLGDEQNWLNDLPTISLEGQARSRSIGGLHTTAFVNVDAENDIS